MKTKRPINEILKGILPQPAAKPRGSRKARQAGFRKAALAAPDEKPAAKRETPLEWANTRLFEAIARGDMPGIDSALERGADINARDKLGRTPLMHAAFDLNQKVEAYLMEKGASRGLIDVDGRSASDMRQIALRLKGTEPSENASEETRPVLPK